MLEEIPRINDTSEVKVSYKEFTCTGFNGVFKKDHYVLTFMNKIFDDSIEVVYTLRNGRKLYPKGNTLQFNFGVIILVMKNGIVTTLSTSEDAEVSYRGVKKVKQKPPISERLKDLIRNIKHYNT